MSAYRNNAKVSPFCKVCKDAGKPESIYTSHFVRANPAPDAKIVCPTLLALECRYCFKNGHTVKYCQELAQVKNANDKSKRKAEYEETKKNKVPTIATNKATNKFDVLENDEPEETVQLQIQVEEAVQLQQTKEDFPSLISAPKTAKAVTQGYATMLAKPALPNIKVTVAPIPSSSKTASSLMNVNWADDSDSENEDW